MQRIILGLAAVLTFSFVGSVAAEEAAIAATDTGKIVVYRDESKSSVSFKVFANETQLGRIKEGKAISADLAAGTYKITSNVKGSEPLVVELKAGQTLYVDGDLIEKRSGKYRTQFTTVSEQVAVTSLPAVNDLI